MSSAPAESNSATGKKSGAWRRRYALIALASQQAVPLAAASETLPTLETARAQLRSLVENKENSNKYLSKEGSFSVYLESLR